MPKTSAIRMTGLKKDLIDVTEIWSKATVHP